MKIISMPHRTTSIVPRVLAGLAGIVALGYTLEGIDFPKFFKDNLAGGLVGIAVPGVLCASAFYMAYKLIRGRGASAAGPNPLETRAGSTVAPFARFARRVRRKSSVGLQ